MDVIFEPGVRTDPRPADGVERMADFLNRVDQPFYDRIRELINHWFSHIPDGPDRNDLGARLRGDDIRHRAAFWELWLHEFLIRSGYNVTIHPESTDGRKRDFLAERDGTSFYLEAHCYFDSDAARGEQRRLAELKRGLARRIHLPHHIIMMSVRSVGPAAAPSRKLAAEVEQTATMVGPGQTREVARMSEDGWDINVTLIGLDARGPTIDMTSINTLEARTGTLADLHIDPVRDALRTKSRDASALDRPYVIAINLCHQNHRMVRAIDIKQALVGTETLVIAPDMKTATPRSNDDGAWTSAGGPRMTSVSALVVASDMAGDWVGASLPVLYRNDGARHPLPCDLPLPTAKIGNDPAIEPTIADGPMRAHELFGLPNDWPGPEEPFSKPYW